MKPEAGGTALITADSAQERVNELLHRIDNFFVKTHDAQEEAARNGTQLRIEDINAFDREEKDLRSLLKQGLEDLQTIEASRIDATIAENMDPDETRADYVHNQNTVENMFREMFESGSGNFVVLPPAISRTPSRNDKFRTKLNAGVYRPPTVSQGRAAFANADPRDRDDDIVASRNSNKYFLQEVVSAPEGTTAMISSSRMEFNPKEHEVGQIYHALDRSLTRLQSDVTRTTTDFPELTTFVSTLDQPHSYIGYLLDPSRVNLKVTPYSTEPIKMALVREEPGVVQPATETTSVTRTDPTYGQVTIGAERSMWTGAISNDAKYSSFVLNVMEQLAETAAIAVRREMNERLTIGTTSGDHTTIGIVNAVRAQSGATGVDAADYEVSFTRGTDADDFNGNLSTLIDAQHLLDIGCYGPKTFFAANQAVFGAFLQQIRTDNASGDINSMWPIIDYTRRDLMRGVLYGLLTEAAVVNNHMAKGGYNTAGATYAIYGNHEAWCTRYTPVEYHVNDTTLAQSDEWFLRARGWVGGNIYWATAAKGIPFVDIKTT